VKGGEQKKGGGQRKEREKGSRGPVPGGFTAGPAVIPSIIWGLPKLCTDYIEEKYDCHLSTSCGGNSCWNRFSSRFPRAYVNISGGQLPS
jgi:hypothetical protein